MKPRILTNTGATLGWRVFSAFAGLAVAMVIGALSAAPVMAGNMQGSIARGGRLYDKWFKEIGADKPTETHALWPASNTKKSGDVTWRCKSCHGWDLQGADGAYGSGSYKTGITGLTTYAGRDPGDVVAILRGPDHGYDGLMSAADFIDLANFVTLGQYDAASVISYETKAVTGDAVFGEAVFNTVCALCHSKAGNKIDGKQMKEPIGLLASGNPWEAMSKILNGQPAEDMPALRAFGLDAASAILAYSQTLPRE